MWSQTHAELYSKLERNTLINLKKSFISVNLKKQIRAHFTDSLYLTDLLICVKLGGRGWGADNG